MDYPACITAREAGGKIYQVTIQIAPHPNNAGVQEQVQEWLDQFNPQGETVILLRVLNANGGEGHDIQLRATMLTSP